MSTKEDNTVSKELKRFYGHLEIVLKRLCKPDIGGLICATVGAIAHHFFLNRYDRKEVLSSIQFWIKASSNGLSQFIAATLALSLTHTLILSIWRTSSRDTVASVLDDMFSLPALSSLGSLLFSSKVSLAVFIAIIIQFLAILTTVVPNSLSAVTTSSSVEQVVIPSLDLSQGNIHPVARGVGDPTYGRWSGVTREYRKLVWALLSSPSNNLWNIAAPPGCGAYCNFGMRFSTPTLKCRDASADEFILGPSTGPPPLGSPWSTDTGVPLYQANSSLVTTQPAVGDPASNQYQYEIDSVYDLIINYYPLTPDWSNGQNNHSGVGTVCTFQQSTVQSTVQFTDSQSYILTNITYEKPIGGNRGQSMPTCWTLGVHTRAMCQAFVDAFTGEIRVDTASGSRTSVSVGNPLAINAIFGSQPQAFGLDFQKKKLNDQLETAFLSVVFGMIPHRTDNATVQLVSARHTLWEYNASLLVGLYTAFILLAFFITMYGIIGMDKTHVDRNLTTLILTSRHRRGDRDIKDRLKSFRKEKISYDLRNQTWR